MKSLRLWTAIFLILAHLLIMMVNTTAARDNYWNLNSSFVGPPYVFILGAAKAGTTSLMSLLVHRLQLLTFSNHMKEPNAFANNFYPQFFQTYIQGFEGSAYGLDASPDYFTHCSKAPMRIVKVYSPASLATKKFIVILRDPLARLLSRYHHIYRECEKWALNGGAAS